MAQIIIEPYFFEDDRGNADAVNDARCRQTIEQQQDGATAHTA